MMTRLIPSALAVALLLGNAAMAAAASSSASASASSNGNSSARATTDHHNGRTGSTNRPCRVVEGNPGQTGTAVSSSASNGRTSSDCVIVRPKK